MNEFINKNEKKPGKEVRERAIKRHIEVAKELIKRAESLSFPGINPESYAKAKAVEEEFPGCSIPIDELLEMFRTQGMRISLGADPEQGDIYILPKGSSDDDIENGMLFPRHLIIIDGMDELFKELIEFKLS